MMSVGSVENLAQGSNQGSRPELKSSRSEDKPDPPKPTNLGLTSHQTVEKLGPIKIHNITVTQDDRQQIFMSSNMQTSMGRQGGPVMGKMSRTRGVRGQQGNGSSPVTQQQQQQHTPLPQQQMLQQHHVQQFTPGQYIQLSTGAVQLMTTSQTVVSNAITSNESVSPTFTTSVKPISTPVPIASKPLPQSPSPGVGGAKPAMSALQPLHQIQQQGLKGTIVLQSNQYTGMTVLNANRLSSPAALAPQGFMTATLRNMTPTQVSSQQQA
ncbi:unnamed protein product, partial [Lymnaea stagnalis]